MRRRASFDTRYRECVRLRDGTRAWVRLLGPHDRGLVRQAFAKLSPTTRYFRFFVGKASLSEEELEYFTNVDQIRHFALIALSDDGAALGSTRGIELAPGIWESAVTVIDAAQGRGLGTALVERLLAAAGERSIREVRFDFLPENNQMRSLLRSLSPHAQFRNGDGIIHCKVYP